MKLLLPNKNTRLLICFLLLWSVACSHTGSTCCDYNQTFRGQWDDYYLRALSCIEKTNFQQALSDFQSSLERRPPSKQYDRRMIRTYGMHYLDYFPNRETGFIYYMQHEYENALKYLNRSIQSEPSAKAFYYRIQSQKKLQTSTGQPELVLTEPYPITQNHSEIWQSENAFFIQGSAYDTISIEEITIQGRPIWINYGPKKIDFSKRFVFEEGKHDIRIQVKNICHATNEKEIILHVDQTGPSISIKKGPQTGTININAQDLSGHLSLIIDQQEILSVSKAILSYAFKWPIGKSEINICVKDRCNNQTCADVTHSQLFYHPKISGLIAENKTIIHSDADFSSIHPISDYIVIDFDQTSPMTVFDKQIHISGKISAKRPIVSVMIKGRPLPIQASKNIYFSRQICLDVGQNQVHVIAKTISGQSKRKTIQAYRKIPSILKPENRFGLSMYPFHVNGQEQNSWLDNLFMITDETQQTSLEMTKSFEENLFMFFKECHRFRINYRGYSESKETGSFPFQGSLLGGAYVSRYGLEITAKIIDNQTSAILGIQDVYRENKGNIDISTMARELSEKIHQSFPLIRGQINSKISDSYRFKCTNSLPKVAWPILVYRKGVDSDTTIIGHGSLMPGNFLNQMGIIVMHDGEAQYGDWVIAR